MISNTRAYDLVYLALREIGVAALGDTVHDDVSREALKVLNSIRAEWSLKAKNYKLYDETFTATTSTTHVSMGAGGDILTRPNRIDLVTVISGTPGPGLNFTLNIRPYESYRSITLTNIYAIPTDAYIDNSYPQQNIWLYPGLSAEWSLRVVGTSYMTEYELLDDPYIDPPEYFSALYLQLALRLAPMYGIDVPQGVVIQAQGAMKHIKANLFSSSLKSMPNGIKSSNNNFSFYGGFNA